MKRKIILRKKGYKLFKSLSLRSLSQGKRTIFSEGGTNFKNSFAQKGERAKLHLKIS